MTAVEVVSNAKKQGARGIPDSNIYSVEHFLATMAHPPPLALHGDARGDDSHAWEVRAFAFGWRPSRQLRTP
jgi:hypothetical protein